MTISLPFGPAGLPQVPALYYVPSRMLNAFAVGQSEEVAIALTDVLLRHLPSRPGELHPEPLTDPDLILSHHPARATVRRLPPSVACQVPPVAG